MERQFGPEYGLENQLFSYGVKNDLPPLTLEQEKQIVLDAREGNLDGIGLLVEHYGHDVYKHVYYMIGNTQIANDIVGDTLIKATQAIHKYEHRGVSLRHWLVKIAHFGAISHLRKKSNKSSLSLNEDIEHPNLTGEFAHEVIEDLDRTTDAKRAVSLFDTLKEEQAEVIKRRFVDGQDYKEVAAALGKSVAAIRVIQHRALRKLKHGMENPHIEFSEESAA